MIIYDITKASTFNNVLRWAEELMNNASENLKIFLIGNKKDLVINNPKLRQVRK